MNIWQLVYLLAGVGAIVAVIGAIARDAYGLYRVVMDNRVGGPTRPDPRPYYALGLAALVGLWLAAAVLR